MSRRGTLVLLVLTLGMGAYIYFVELRSKTTEELAELRQRIAPGFQRDRTKEIILVRGTEKIALSKASIGKWEITEPTKYPADDGSVDQILSGLEFLEFERRIDDKDASKRSDYGLVSPRAQITLKGTGTLTLRIGANDATGRNVFLARGEESTVFVVEKHFFESITKPLNELRDQRALVFDRSKVRSVTIERGGERVRLRRDEQTWSLTEPWKLLAATEPVDQLVAKIEALRLSHFVGDELANLPKYGLEPPAGMIEVDDGQTQTLLIGAPCAERATDVYVARKGRASAIACANLTLLEEVPADPTIYREMRLHALRPDEVREVRIEAGGKEVTLSREEGSWWITTPSRQRGDDDAIRKWIEDLGTYRATRLQEAKEAFQRPARVTIAPEHGKPRTIAFGSKTAGLVSARRDDEPIVLLVHAEAMGRVRADPLTFRARRVLEFSRYEAKKIEARWKSRSEVLEYRDGAWKLVEPTGIGADDEQVDALLTKLSELRAEAFLAAQAAPPHGLGTPTRAFTLTVEPAAELDEGKDEGKKDEGPGGDGRKKTHTLTIGADLSEGACYARVGGLEEPVFTLAPDTCKVLRRPLATRKLFVLEEEKLIGFAVRKNVRNGIREVVVEKRGPDWHRIDGQKVEKSRIDQLVALLRDSKARDALAYGIDRAKLQPPHLGVTVRTDGKPDQQLEVGIRERDSEGAYHAVFGNREVTYLVDRHLVEQIEAWEP